MKHLEWNNKWPNELRILTSYNPKLHANENLFRSLCIALELHNDLSGQSQYFATYLSGNFPLQIIAYLESREAAVCPQNVPNKI